MARSGRIVMYVPRFPLEEEEQVMRDVGLGEYVGLGAILFQASILPAIGLAMLSWAEKTIKELRRQSIFGGHCNGNGIDEAFRVIYVSLRALGCTFSDVWMISSEHVDA